MSLSGKKYASKGMANPQKVNIINVNVNFINFDAILSRTVISNIDAKIKGQNRKNGKSNVGLCLGY